jgi:hypothetical protein
VNKARVQVDVATARIAPHNPMTDDGMVHLYDPLLGTVEAARTAELVSRLPQYNQLVRVFTDERSAIGPLHDVTRRVLAAR